MNPQLLAAQRRDEVPAWAQTVLAFLAAKERRSGSRRTVEGYARMLWPFFERVGSPDRVTLAHVLAWADGIGASGREPSSATVGARIACLSSYYRFLIRMNVASANPCDALERPRTVQAVARGLADVRRAHGDARLAQTDLSSRRLGGSVELLPGHVHLLRHDVFEHRAAHRIPLHIDRHDLPRRLVDPDLMGALIMVVGPTQRDHAVPDFLGRQRWPTPRHECLDADESTAPVR